MFAIQAENLSKVYRFYKKPAHRLLEALLRRPMHEAYSSLENVSFCVHNGESLGIIGENGAGKSTLLKILAGTLTPSSGMVETRGRVAALLELGAGFHQEFTGRQNIFLNASLFGLSDQEIREKEKDILDFAEIGQFIDQPIKTYSSGMVVRLAFSIATSVDPDILIIDEALSVGDQYFQKKCVDRMLSFRQKGKTIIFCSHSLYIINLLCNRTLWIEKGKIKDEGESTEITARYENFLRLKETFDSPVEQIKETGPNKVQSKLIMDIIINGDLGPAEIQPGQNLEIEIQMQSFDNEPFALAMGLHRNDGLLCHAVNLSRDQGRFFCGPGTIRLKIIYPALPLLYGNYKFVAFLLDESGVYCYHKKDAPEFAIAPSQHITYEIGLLELNYEWKILSENVE